MFTWYHFGFPGCLQNVPINSGSTGGLAAAAGAAEATVITGTAQAAPFTTVRRVGRSPPAFVSLEGMRAPPRVSRWKRKSTASWRTPQVSSRPIHRLVKSWSVMLVTLGAGPPRRPVGPTGRLLEGGEGAAMGQAEHPEHVDDGRADLPGEHVARRWVV